MASMTDYMVLSDDPFELSDSPSGPGDVKELEFDLPDNFTVGTFRGKPILAFVINPVSDNVSVGGWVNPEGPNIQLTQSTQDVSLSWDGDFHFDQALWEAIDGRKFNKGGHNSVFFKAWDGRVWIRDVVLWYQRGPGD
jgi:hypothetical protein